MERKTYRWCAVPQCRNTSISTPSKLFIDVPRKADIRKKWLDVARRKDNKMSVNSAVYFCEDHFDLPNDMENYMRYHVMGSVKKINLKPGCLPSKFQCQTDRKRSLPSTSTSRPAAVKRQRLAIVQDAIEESKLKSNIEEENTAPSLDLTTDVVIEHQPKSQDKGVQVFVKSKYFRSKYTQTDSKSQDSQDIGTSPSKQWTTSTSPFKVKHVELSRPSVSNINRKLMDGSDSDISLYTPSTSFQKSSSSVQSLQSKITSDSSSLNEEEAKIEKEREAKKALNNMCKKIEANPRLYVGITKECYFLVDLIHANTNIPTEHILLCLKKIRLNSTFSELADQFEMSTSYAGKIFLKNIPIIANLLKPFIVELDKKN